MSTFARDVINAARDFHPLFTRQSTPDIVALRRIARYQQSLLTDIARLAADRVHTSQTITVPFADFAAGVVLEPYLRVHGASAAYIDTSRTPRAVELVEYPLRLDGIATDNIPRAFIQGGKFMPLGIAEDWIAIASVTVDFFPMGPDTVQLGDKLFLPGNPLRACASDVAAFMAQRAGTAPIDYIADRESYLDEVTERRIAKVGVIREVW